MTDFEYFSNIPANAGVCKEALNSNFQLYYFFFSAKIFLFFKKKLLKTIQSNWLSGAEYCEHSICKVQLPNFCQNTSFYKEFITDFFRVKLYSSIIHTHTHTHIYM